MSNAQLPPHPRFRRRVAVSSASVRREHRKQRTSSQYDKKKRKGKKEESGEEGREMEKDAYNFSLLSWRPVNYSEFVVDV